MRVELRDPDVTDIIALHVPGDRPHLNHFPRQLQLDGAILALAAESHTNGAIDRPAYLVHRLLHGQALDRLAIDSGDQIVSADAGPRRGGLIDGRYDLELPVLHHDFDAEASKLAVRARLHVAKALRVHVVRMWIE